MVGITSAAVAVLASSLWFANLDKPSLDQVPQWLTGAATDGPSGSSHLRTTLGKVDGTAEDGAVAAMLPPHALAAPVTAVRSRESFQASVLMPAGLTHEVAECIVSSAEAHYRILDVVRAAAAQATKESGRQSTAKAMEFFFASWPDLAEMLQDGDVGIEVAKREPNNYGSSVGTIVYRIDAPNKVLSANIHSAKWFIKLRYTSGGRAQTLLDELFAMQ